MNVTHSVNVFPFVLWREGKMARRLISLPFKPSAFMTILLAHSTFSPTSLSLYRPSPFVHPSSRLSLGGGCSHQYLWLRYRRCTQHLLGGRAINGIRGGRQRASRQGSVVQCLAFSNLSHITGCQ